MSTTKRIKEINEEVERIHRLYLPVYNLDVTPNTFELPNYYAARDALKALVSSLMPNPVVERECNSLNHLTKK